MAAITVMTKAKGVSEPRWPVSIVGKGKQRITDDQLIALAPGHKSAMYVLTEACSYILARWTGKSAATVNSLRVRRASAWGKSAITSQSASEYGLNAPWWLTARMARLTCASFRFHFHPDKRTSSQEKRRDCLVYGGIK